MNEAVFLPPTFEAPASGDSQGNYNSAPNQNNSAPRQEGREAQGQWAKSVGRSKVIKQATNFVIKTRSQFKVYLQGQGMDLYTSAVEFQESGDFIASSYVIYRNYQDYKEPLFSFLQRYPSLQQPVLNIRDSLAPAKSHMQVITKKNEPVNPFAGLGS